MLDISIILYLFCMLCLFLCYYVEAALQLPASVVSSAGLGGIGEGDE